MAAYIPEAEQHIRASDRILYWLSLLNALNLAAGVDGNLFCLCAAIACGILAGILTTKANRVARAKEHAIAVIALIDEVADLLKPVTRASAMESA